MIFNDFVLSILVLLPYYFHCLIFCSDFLTILCFPGFPFYFALLIIIFCAYFLLLPSSPHFFYTCSNSCAFNILPSSFHTSSISHFFYFVLFFVFIFFLSWVSQTSSIHCYTLYNTSGAYLPLLSRVFHTYSTLLSLWFSLFSLFRSSPEFPKYTLFITLLCTISRDYLLFLSTILLVFSPHGSLSCAGFVLKTPKEVLRGQRGLSSGTAWSPQDHLISFTQTADHLQHRFTNLKILYLQTFFLIYLLFIK